MNFLKSALDNKEEYTAQVKSSIKHANFVQYEKLVKKSPDYIFKLRKIDGNRHAYKQVEEAEWDHMQLLALLSTDMHFFKQAYEFLLSVGFTPTGLKKKHATKKHSTVDLIATNGKDKKFNEGSLEYLLSTKLLFDPEHNFSSQPHKLSFLAALKHLKVISDKTYSNLYDKHFDDSFYKRFPIYRFFTKEEIKKFNLFQTVCYQEVDPATYWTYKNSVEELALDLCNRKSKQAKKFIFHFCFESKRSNAMENVGRFLKEIKDADDQKFYWALELYLKELEQAPLNDIVLLVKNFDLFDQAKNFTVTKKRIEKLFELQNETLLAKEDENDNITKIIESINDIPLTQYSDRRDYEGDFAADDLETLMDLDISPASIHDTVEMMRKATRHNIPYNIKDFSTGRELHDHLSLELDTVNSINHELRQEEIAKLDKRKFLDLTIIVPKQSHDLKIVGRMLNICVGTASYDIKILKKQSNVIFLMKEQKIWACVEFANGQVIQMKHKNNINVEESIQKKFSLLLKSLYGKGDLLFLDESKAIKINYPETDNLFDYLMNDLDD